MIHLENTPPDDPRGTSLPLLRCPPNRALVGTIVSHDLVGCNTHYYRGRSIPCDQGQCPACEDGMPWRWHAWVGLWLDATGKIVLLELTAAACEPLKTYREAYGTLRGCRLKAQRANSSPNSRVILQTKPADLEKITLPAEPNVLNALSIIWGLANDELTVDGLQKDSPRLQTEAKPERRSDRIQHVLEPYTKPNGRS